jgi:hypothetical protein
MHTGNEAHTQRVRIVARGVENSGERGDVDCYKAKSCFLKKNAIKILGGKSVRGISKGRITNWNVGR